MRTSTEEERITRAVEQIRQLGLMDKVWDGILQASKMSTVIAEAVKAGIKKEDFLRTLDKTWDEYHEIERRIAKGMASVQDDDEPLEEQKAPATLPRRER